MKNSRTTIAVLAALAFVFGMATSSAYAQDNVGTDAGFAPIGEGVQAVPPEMNTFENVVDKAEMEEIEAITERIQPHLFVDDSGLVQMDPEATAESLGVTETFFLNYLEALEWSNLLISGGEINVDQELRVSAVEGFVGEAEMPSPGGPGAGGMSGVYDDVTDNEVPDWSAWRYNHGSMYYNSYNTYQNYYRTRNYYGLCNTMAAYIGYPRFSNSLVNFYTYNSSYMNRYCYQNSGAYYFLPYSSRGTCQGGYPGYSQTSYKPAYYWGQSYAYNNSCRCYRYTWSWQGSWCRY